MNIYTQSFKLLNCNELSDKLMNFTFKKYLTEIHFFDNYNGYECKIIYQIFNSKYKFLNKHFGLSVYSYIKINKSEFSAVIKNIIKQIKSKFEYNKKIELYIILHIDQENIIYENFKNILDDFGFKNDLMIISSNSDILWKKNDIMINSISERNKFLINEFKTTQNIENIDLFKREFSYLFIIMFKIMKTNINRR